MIDSSFVVLLSLPLIAAVLPLPVLIIATAFLGAEKNAIRD